MAANFYETGKALSEYLYFHYGDDGSPVEMFPVTCVRDCIDARRLPANARALDLGCAVGRSAFELARHCAEVIGIDYSRAFIDAATKLRNRGALKFQYLLEGELTAEAVARTPHGVDARRVHFEVGDAMKLRADIGAFDVVLMANLIDRLPDPRRCLAQAPSLVNPGGQLIIASPYTWLEGYTPRAKWLGGFKRGKREVHAFDSLAEILEPSFKLARRRDLPFLIREHARKFQLGISDATVWTRKK